MQQALAECNRLSCNLHNNIYSGSTKRPGSVHSFATGIGSTSVDGTRDWLLSNVLQASDDYSRDLATNMTSLIRSKYDVDDRIRKAWFINPANKWTISPSNNWTAQYTGTQSRLLLSDRLIMFAVIVLNDGNGKIMRRRLLSFSSEDGKPATSMVPVTDVMIAGGNQKNQEVQIASRHLLQTASSAVTTITEEQVSALLQKMSNTPRTGVMPPVDFRVGIPYTLASAYGVEHKPYLFLEIGAVGLFDQLQWTPQQVKNAL